MSVSEGVESLRFSADSLVVLAGPSGSGKSSWAARWFESNQCVSTDDLRSVVGEHQHDLRASADAFALVDLIIERRLRRGLLTVIDSLGMDPARNLKWQEIAAANKRPSHLVVFDTDPKVCRKRNKGRSGEVPSRVMTAQLRKWEEIKGSLSDGFTFMHAPAPASIVPRSLLPVGDSGGRSPLQFGLTLSSFDWPIEANQTGDRLGEIAAEAEHSGFDSLWLMDHFMQIPQIGREWDPMLECYTTLGYLAGRTTRISIGALVSCVTHRNIALLGKIVATLDVLSGGRAWCGLGVGWFEREHKAYGYRFPPVSERYELLEDALGFLPLLWGPGSPPFNGHHLAIPEAICYPRPLQNEVPILIGGSGERRTLQLVAKHGDACNLFGEPDVIRKKVSVLHRHCDEVDRDPTEILITQLSSVITAPDVMSLKTRVAQLKGPNESAANFTTRTNAGTVEQHLDRFGRLAEAGVQSVIVSLGDIGHPGAITEFAPIVDALSSNTSQ